MWKNTIQNCVASVSCVRFDTFENLKVDDVEGQNSPDKSYNRKDKPTCDEDI